MADISTNLLCPGLQAENDRLRQEIEEWQQKCQSLAAGSVLDEQEIESLKEVLEDKRRLTRELDIALNGEEGAAEQASLCDLIEPARRMRQEITRLKGLVREMAFTMGTEFLEILSRPDFRAILEEK